MNRQILRSHEMCYPNKDEFTGGVWSLSPDPPQSAWTHLERIHTYQYSGSARGKSAASRWHISSLLLPMAGVGPPGHAEGKEHADAPALLS
jgi:hypothetical protein